MLQRAPARSARAGLLLAGILLGVILALLGVRWLVREAGLERVREAVLREVELPEEVFEIEEVRPDSTLRVALRDVAILDRAGDTLVAAPVVRFVFDPSSLPGEDPLELREVEIVEPLVNLVQRPDGEWNLAQAFAVEAGGERVGPGEEEEGRGVVLRDVSIVDGRVRLATPWSPEDTAALFGPPPEAQLAQVGGRTMQLRTARDLDARLPLVRFGGGLEWRVEVAEADAVLTNPDVRLAALEGWVEEEGEGFRFALDVLRTPDSFLEGEGVVGLAGAEPTFDVRVQAHRLSFRDLQWLRPDLPEEGFASFVLEAETLPGGRTLWAVRDAEVRALESFAYGDLTVVTGGDAPPAFRDTRITLDPLLLSDLEALGVVEELPYTGRVTGTVTSVGVIEGAEGALRLDLTAQVEPEGLPGVPESVVTARGLVAFGAGEPAFRFQDLRLEFDPLHLAALAPLMEEPPDLLRGVLRGSVLVSGTPRDLRVAQGTLAYEVGDAPPSRLRIEEARVVLDPELRYTLRARAEPLALATLTELFPGLPFRRAALAGPVFVEGTREAARFDVDLTGAAGGLAVRGDVTFGDPLRFDVAGRVEAFRPAALLTAEVPAEGPLTGTFAAAGTAEDFRFEVDLAQAEGRFALEGRVRRGAGPPQFDVAGMVTDFRLGALIGRPGLLPGPVTGTVAVTGGGRQPIRFDVDVRGAVGALDLEGFYAPGPVPEYAVSGTVAGLNLEDLPVLDVIPRTDLTGRVELRGRGTTLETLGGELAFTLTGPSTVAGIPLETATLDVAVREGVLVVDELVLALSGARLTAEGSWGLTRPVQEPLRFTLVARELRTLAAVIPPPGPLEPPMGGSVQVSGWVAGSFREPTLALTGSARDLRFREWAAGALSLRLEASRTAERWVGDLALQGDNLVLAGAETLDALRLEASVTPELASFGVFARRSAESDLAASGVLEFEGPALRGAQMETLTVRAGPTTWQLEDQARIRWGGVEGIAIDNLVLNRTGEATGRIAIDGRVPPTGRADLRVQAWGVNLAELRRIAGRGPEVAGLLTLNAVVEGPVGNPEIALDVRVDSLRYGGVELDRFALDAAYAGQRLVVDSMSAWMGGEQILSGEAAVPLAVSVGGGIPSAEVLENEPVTARVEADSVPVGLLAGGITGLRDGEGVLGGEIRLRGTPADPRLFGWAGISGGAVTVDTLGTRFEQIRGRATLDGRLVRIDSLVAHNEGSARLEGTIRLDDPEAPVVFLTGTMEDFRVIDQERVATLLTSGRLAVSGPLTAPVLSGRLVLDEGTITIPEFDEAAEADYLAEFGEIGVEGLAEPAAPPVAAALGPMRIENLEVVVEDDVWLVSDDARIQIAGELLILRPGETPLVYGELEAIRGTYALEVGRLIRREFEIERGRVEFFGTPDLNPALDIVAASEIRTLSAPRGAGSTLRILVTITGTLEEPRLSLTSATRPPLPEEELFSYLVFGQPTFALGQEATGLAQQILLERFLAGYLAGELERGLVRTGLPVDYVRVRTGPTGTFGDLAQFESAVGLGGTTVEFGTEIGEGIFFTVTLGSFFAGQPTVGFGVEWEIDPHWSLRAAREVARQDRRFFFENNLDYQWAADIFWRREFGFPEERTEPVFPREATPLPGEAAPAPEEPSPPEPNP